MHQSNAGCYLKIFSWIAPSQCFSPCSFHRTLPKTCVSLWTQEKHLVFHIRDICAINPPGCALLGVILDKPVIGSGQDLHRWEAEKPTQTRGWVIKRPSLLHLLGIHFLELQTLLSFMESLFGFSILSKSYGFPLKPCYSLTKKNAFGSYRKETYRQGRLLKAKQKTCHFGNNLNIFKYVACTDNCGAFVRSNDTY